MFLGYIGLALSAPVVLIALIAFVLGVLLLFGTVLGVKADERWGITAVLALLIAAVLWAWARMAPRLAARRRVGSIVPLPTIISRGIAKALVGGKAYNLARMQVAGVAVPQSWVVPSCVFEKVAGNEAALTTEYVEALCIPRRTLRRIARTLTSASGDHFLLRSSFSVEDGLTKAHPGIYRSVPWRPQEGIAALERALLCVWRSYWEPQALAYRREISDGTSPPRLSVLICTVVDHDLNGFASSAEVTTGFRERHMVEISTPTKAWTGVLDTLRNEWLSPPTGNASTPGDDVCRTAARLAGQAEIVLGVPAEIEWGHYDS